MSTEKQNKWLKDTKDFFKIHSQKVCIKYKKNTVALVYIIAEMTTEYFTLMLAQGQLILIVMHLLLILI